MTTLRNLLIITLALLLQSTFFGRMHIFGARPDLGMLALIFIAGGSDTTKSIFYGFLIGFFQDVYTPEYLGYNAFTMSLMGFALGALRETLAIENLGIKACITFIACLVHDFIYLAFYTRLDFSLFGKMFVTGSPPGALFTTALASIFIITYEWSLEGGLKLALRELFGSRR